MRRIQRRKHDVAPLTPGPRRSTVSAGDEAEREARAWDGSRPRWGWELPGRCEGVLRDHRRQGDDAGGSGKTTGTIGAGDGAVTAGAFTTGAMTGAGENVCTTTGFTMFCR